MWAHLHLFMFNQLHLLFIYYFMHCFCSVGRGWGKGSVYKRANNIQLNEWNYLHLFFILDNLIIFTNRHMLFFLFFLSFFFFNFFFFFFFLFFSLIFFSFFCHCANWLKTITKWSFLCLCLHVRSVATHGRTTDDEQLAPSVTAPCVNNYSTKILQKILK